MENIPRNLQSSLQNFAGKSQFTVSNIPFHIHNGVDAPFVYSPLNIYTGFVPTNADLSGQSTSGYIFFPQGWRVEVDGTPVYRITHNLNTSFYSVMACLTGPDFPLAWPATNIQKDYFEIAWIISDASTVHADFHFLLTQINNGQQNVPLYNAHGG